MSADQIELHLVVSADASAERREEVADVADALGEAGVRARPAPAAEVPLEAIRLVWAGDLAGALAAVPEAERERWLDSTIVVNEDEERVVELLGERALLGAVEYGDLAEWREAGAARLFVRRGVVKEGDPGVPAESEAYRPWSEPRTRSLAAALAEYLAHWREVDAELVIGADEARARKLPPVEIGLHLGGTGLFRVPPAHSIGYYVVLSSAPGGAAGFAARPAEGDLGAGDLEAAARRMLQNPRGPELVAAGVELVRLAGRERDAICLFADWLSFRTASCVVRLEHAAGAVMAIFIASVGETRPSSGMVLADPSLRRIARTLRITDSM